MAEAGGELNFPEESCRAVGPGEVRPHDLDGHNPPMLPVERAVHIGHAAASRPRLEQVFARKGSGQRFEAGRLGIVHSHPIISSGIRVSLADRAFAIRAGRGMTEDAACCAAEKESRA